MKAGARDNILIKAPNWLGDLVLFIPALRALGRRSPESRLCVVGNEAARDVVSLSQLDVDFVYFDRHRPGASPAADRPAGEPAGRGRRSPADVELGGGWGAALSALRMRRWALGITFAEGFSSALLLRLAGVSRSLGYRGDGKELLLSTALPREGLGKRPHLAVEYMALAEAGGGVPDGSIPIFFVPKDLAAAADLMLERSGLDLSRPIVGLCPGAAYGPSKQWPAGEFAQVGLELARGGLGVAVFGAPSEEALAREVAGAVTGGVSLAGKTSVLTLAASLGRCAVVVANDSGAAHLAAAVGAPVVAVFASSDPSWTRPLGEKVRVVRSDLECSPCFEKQCDIGYPCLTGIAASDVVKIAMSLVGEVANGGISI
jgi:heptosyltransferase-2